MSALNADVIDEERNVYTRPMVIRNNRTIFFFPPFFAKRDKSEGYGEDALDGGYSGDGGRDTRRLTDAAI